MFCLLQAIATARSPAACSRVDYLKVSNEVLKGRTLFSCSIYPFRLFFQFVCLFVCFLVPTCVLACSTEDVEVRPAKAGAESHLSNDFSINFRRSCRRTFTGDLTKLRPVMATPKQQRCRCTTLFCKFLCRSCTTTT